MFCDVVSIWHVHSGISGISELRPLAQRHVASTRSTIDHFVVSANTVDLRNERLLSCT
jgi:hypothetical protein